MKKRVFALALTLALCLGLAVPALAAGEPMTVTGIGWVVTPGSYGAEGTVEIDASAGEEEVGVVRISRTGEGEIISSAISVAVKVTASNILRKESGLYTVWDVATNIAAPESLTFYVIPDEGVTLTYTWEGTKADSVKAATPVLWWSSDEARMMRGAAPFEPDFCEMGNTFTTDIKPDPEQKTAYYVSGFDGLFICESSFKQLVPFEGTMNCAGWAAASMETAFENSLFPDGCNPYVADLARSMTRAEFAETAVNLYKAMRGDPAGNLGVSNAHPFTDVDWNTSIGYAYNLGFVNGTSDTTFSPDGTLTREQAAVMLSRVYAKLHGDIPAAAATAFADDAQVGGWAKNSVAFMADKGIVSGVGGNNFAPQQTLSVQEAMVMAVRMLEKLK